MSKLGSAIICIVGCGRRLRRDDQIGLRVAEALDRVLESANVVVHTTEAPAGDIPNWLDGIGLLVIVDAAAQCPTHPAGSFARINYRADPCRIRARLASDTHGMDVGLALQLADRLGILPMTVWIYPVMITDPGAGEGLSPAVESALPAVVRTIQDDISQWLEPRECCHA